MEGKILIQGVIGNCRKFLGDTAIELESLIPQNILKLAQSKQSAIPTMAKNPDVVSVIQGIVKQLPTCHTLILDDSRYMENISDESVHLVVTSPPYWNLKLYPQRDGQLGLIEDYETFLSELDKVWQHALRVLVPGGRLVVVVGDVCLSRRKYGRHVVFPLHASIQEHCRKIGFDNLAPIIWSKISNAKFEANNGSKFLGKPYEPNAVIKHDIEYILFQRKPGGYRQPDLASRVLSIIPEKCHREFFQQIWTVGGASTKQHPAPYPLELAERLVRMFSFVGDIILDPFMGTGVTNLAAAHWGRHSIGFEIEADYLNLARKKLKEYGKTQIIIKGKEL